MTINEKISLLKEEIETVKEYLYSDICSQCGEAAQKLGKLYQELNDLLIGIER